jgi:acyl-CoA synthetase (AMP-forming)/AMP-acid ligase II
MTADLLSAFLATCDAQADAPALTAPRHPPLTYRALAQAILSTRDNLLAAGLAPGDRMLFSIRPGPPGLILSLATVAAGGTVVFMDPGASPALFAARTALATPRWAAAESLLYAASSLRPARTIARRRGLLLPDYAALPVRHVYSGPWLPGVPRKALSATRLARLARGNQTSTVPPHPDQDAVVIFTSGTTSDPKAVVHTRGSLAAGLDILATGCAIGPGDTVHTDQFMLGLPALIAGAHWTMPPFGFRPAADPARFARGLVGATHTFLVPADLAAILDVAPPTLRCLMVGAAPVTPALLHRARKALPDTEILAMYGMTEIPPVAIATAEEKIAGAELGDLVGAPLPGIRARIAEDGELMVSGPNLCRGYLGQEPMAEHHTGDLATLVDGRIVLAGRKKDMIIRGAVNVYPGLYEPVIATLPGVASAAMIGIPDELGDERIVLAVSAGTSEPPRVLKGHPLAGRVRAALPDLIDAAALPDDVVVVTAIPTAGRSRKPDRAALRVLIG